MDIPINLLSVKVSSKPILRTIGAKKVLEFQVNNQNNEFTCHIWGKYGEMVSKYLNIGHELSGVGRMMPANRVVLDRVLMTEKSWIARHLAYSKAMLLIKLEELWPFRRKTPEEPVPAEKSLVDMVLEWWEEERYEQVYLGDGEYDNMWTEEPDFVTIARQIQEEVIIE